MKPVFGRRILAILIATGLAGVAAAQEIPGRGEMALGNGQMVRGTVTATASDHLTIKTDAGETYQVALSPNTRMMKNREPLKPTDVKVGDGVGAMGELDAPKKTVHALFVAVMDAEQVKKLREGLGKEYIAGKVTAIDEVKLTILRPDNVTQVIEVDETTSFRRGGGRRNYQSANGNSFSSMPGQSAGTGQINTGGESITLAEIKVGDMVTGQGSVKHGVFVPTTLAVIPPTAMTQRMHRNGEGTSGTASPAPKQ